MRKRFSLFFLVVFTCVELVAVFPLFSYAGSEKEDLFQLTDEFRQACQVAQFNKAVVILKQIETWKLDRGLRNARFLSDALLRMYENSALREQNNSLQRLMVIEAIGRLSPDDSTLRWRIFESYLMARPFDVYHLFKKLRNVWNAIDRDIGWKVQRLAEIVFIGIFAFFMSLFSLAVCLLMKYSSHIIFYVKRFIRFPVNTLLAVLLALIVFFIPLYLNLGLVWLPLFWMVLLWLILSRSEKVVVLFLIGILVGIGAGSTYIGKILSACSNRGTYLLYCANYDLLEPTALKRLQIMAKIPKKDVDVLFTLGLLAKREGNYKRAIAYYRAAIQVAPNFSECMNNLGNVYLLMGRGSKWAVEKARKWYKKAISVDPSRAEFFYNLSRTYPLLQVEGMEYIVRARDLNPELIDQLTRRKSESPNQKLVDCLLPLRKLWHRAFLPNKMEAAINSLFTRFFLRNPFGNIYIVPAVLLFLIVIFTVIQRKVELAIPCSRCGQFFFRPIPIRYSRTLCHQCQFLQQRSSQADPELVKQKEKEVMRYRRRKKILTFLIGLIPAGGGFIYRGQVAVGVIATVLFFLFLNVYLVLAQILPGTPVWFFGYSHASIGCLIAGGIVYVGSLWPMILTFLRKDF